MKITVGESFVLPLPQLMLGARPLNMIWVNPGKFMMGMSESDPDFALGEDSLLFENTITLGYWLGQYELTQAQWIAIMDHNPSQFAGINHPVENVSWYMAMEFCGRLNKLNRNFLPRRYKFNLPTEAQWEYACRAGTVTRYHSGNSSNELDSVAWHLGNSNGSTQNVGGKKPNDWGFYDIHGNAQEWCYDTETDYPKEPFTDWVHHGDGKFRVIRGGSFSMPLDAPDFNCGARGFMAPEDTFPFLGVRIALSRFN